MIQDEEKRRIDEQYGVYSRVKGSRVGTVVTLRGPSTKQFWNNLERFGTLLEELGVGGEEVENV